MRNKGSKTKKTLFAGKLYVTVDTEMDADTHWKKAYPPQFSSVLYGIPRILRPIWDRHHVTPVYFVSPEVAEDQRCCAVLKEELKRGAVIGAHLHPEYIDPDRKDMAGNAPAEFPCSAYSREAEKEKLQNLTGLIEENIGVTPVWYRAARFGADADTVSILEELGYRYDSSFTPGIDWSDRNGPDHRNAPLKRYYINPEDIYHADARVSEGVQELPVTIMGKRWGILGRILPENWMCYRWLRPSHMTYLEERGLIRQLRKKQVRDIVMMFHSMEVMVGKTPYVRTGWMQAYYLWRLEKTLAFARRMGYSGDIRNEL